MTDAETIKDISLHRMVGGHALVVDPHIEGFLHFSPGPGGRGVILAQLRRCPDIARSFRQADQQAAADWLLDQVLWGVQ